jgi:hypothetical protein
VAQGGTGASTAEGARAALDVYSKGAVDAALGGIRAGTAHAPQSIIKAPLGPRPDGWTAADCDAPVASLSHSGTAVTVEAGLQVAYADGGNVYPSEVLAAPQSVDLSAAADGTSYIYADIAEDGTFSGFGHADVAPDVGGERSGKDIMPAFSTYTLSGWGTVSADSEYPGGYQAYKAFDKYQGTSTTATNTWLGNAAGVGFLCIAFEKPRGVLGFILGVSAYTSAIQGVTSIGRAPTSFDFVKDGGIVKSIVGESWTAYGQKKIYLFDSVQYGTQFKLDIKATSGGVLPAVAIMIPIFTEDLYNPTTVTMYDKDDNPIRRVYLGTAAKSSGAITSAQGFALGDRVRLAATGTILDNPFGGWHVQATQGTALLSATPTTISGVTVNTTPVVVRR